MSKTLRVKLTPSAARSGINGWTIDNTGNPYLKVSVTSVPEKGKANKALIALLAKHFKVPKSSIAIIKGDTERLKTLSVPDDFPLEI